MALAQVTKTHETSYTLNDAMDVLLTKLDDAIDDITASDRCSHHRSRYQM